MIYAIQMGEDGPIKFGVTLGNLQNRLSMLQTGNPKKLRVLAAADMHESYECVIHYHLRDCRLHGEWFKPHIKTWQLVWALERQAYSHDHEVTNHIYENDMEAVRWFRRRIGIPESLDGD